MTTLTPRKLWVTTVFQGDDMDRLSQLRRAAGPVGAAARLDDEPDDAEAAYAQAVEEAASRAIDVYAVHIGRRAYRDLLTAHPPRADNDVDQELGWNDDTFPDELLARAVVTEPAVDDLDTFLDRLSVEDAELAFSVAVAANEGRSADPRGSRYSSHAPSTDETSGSLERLG